MTFPQDEAEDRVIARALNAEITYAETTDDQIDEADMDVAAVDEYQRVLAHLTFEEIAPPTGLEDRVLAAALTARPATVRSIDRTARRRATVRWGALGGAVAAAAGVIAFMVATGDAGNGIDGGQVQLTSDGSVEAEVLEQPGVRQADLISTAERRLPQDVGDVALAPDGRGALYDLRLPATGPDEMILVWLVTADSLVPIGELPASAAEAGIEIQGDADAVKGIALSVQTGTGTPDEPGPILARATF